MNFDSVIEYTLDQAIADGVLVELFKNRWKDLSGGKPIVVRVTSRQIDHQARGRADSSPEPLEATACDPCVKDRVFRISMPEIILDQPEIVASVGEVEAARVP